MHSTCWQRIQVFGHTSGVTVTGTYSTKDGANLGELLLPSDLQTGNKDHSWFLSAQFVYYLHQSAQQPGEAWGVFLKTAASDGNPNPFQGSIMGGVGGTGLFDSRPNDTFGLGYFYVDFSDELQSSIDPLVTFQDEQGIEAFYNCAVTDWLLVAADLQYVNPALGATDNALVAGLRATIRF
jgi:porin